MLQYVSMAQIQNPYIDGQDSHKLIPTLLEQEYRNFDECKLVLNKHISGRYRSTDGNYDEVGVLLLSWQDDDLYGNASEMLRLAALFQHKLHYNIEQFRIPSEGSTSALLARVAQFAHQYNSPNKLAIIYYGGHSIDDEGKLRLYAKWRADGDGDPSSLFDDTFGVLQFPNTDVLVIADTCYASRAFSKHILGQRKFELLAACPADRKAYPPGVHSFTNHLCDGLEFLIDQKPDGFSTSDLYREIYFQNGDSKPSLFDLSRVDYGRIWFKALPQPGPEARDSTSDFDSSSRPEVYLHIKVRLNSDPEPFMMHELALSMQYLPHVKELRFEHLHAPFLALRRYVYLIRCVKKLRPILVRIRQRRELGKVRDEYRNRSTDDISSMEHRVNLVVRNNSDLYNWKNVEHELQRTSRGQFHLMQSIFNKPQDTLGHKEDVDRWFKLASRMQQHNWFIPAVFGALLAIIALKVIPTDYDASAFVYFCK